MTTTEDLCFYCGALARLTGKIEHIIPSAIGGNRTHDGSAEAALATNHVCDGCNLKAGREIDQPFVETIAITTLRALIGAPNRGRRPPLLPLPGRLDWDHPETADVFTAGSFFFVRLRAENGDTFVEYYTASTPDEVSEETREQLEEVANTMVRKSTRLGLARSSNSRLEELHQLFTQAFGTVNPTVKFRSTTTEDSGAILREGAKIALGVLCAAFPRFVASEAAHALRLIAFHQKPANLCTPVLTVSRSRFSLFAYNRASSSARHHLLINVDRGVIRFRVTFYDAIWVEVVLDAQGVCADFNGDLIYEIDPVSKRSIGLRIPQLL